MKKISTILHSTCFKIFPTEGKKQTKVMSMHNFSSKVERNVTIFELPLKIFLFIFLLPLGWLIIPLTPNECPDWDYFQTGTSLAAIHYECLNLTNCSTSTLLQTVSANMDCWTQREFLVHSCGRIWLTARVFEKVIECRDSFITEWKRFIFSNPKKCHLEIDMFV